MPKPADRLNKLRDGLAILQPSLEHSLHPQVSEGVAAPGSDAGIRHIPLDQIVVGGINARILDEDDPEIAELAHTIQDIGLLQPVRVGVDGERYRLIAGERRYRAVQQLGWPSIPAIVTTTDAASWPIEMLIENLQRKNLEPWEEAQGYQQLLLTGLSLGQLATRVGKSKGYISVMLKLTSHASIRAALQARAISSLSLARELNPLLNQEGEEVRPNAVDEAIRYIRLAHPTILELREWVRDRLAEPGAAPGMPAVGKRSPSSFLKKEEAHLQEVRTRQFPRLSPIERQALRQLLAEHIQYLDALDMGDRTPESD